MPGPPGRPGHLLGRRPEDRPGLRRRPVADGAGAGPRRHAFDPGHERFGEGGRRRRVPPVDDRLLVQLLHRERPGLSGRHLFHDGPHRRQPIPVQRHGDDLDSHASGRDPGPAPPLFVHDDRQLRRPEDRAVARDRLVAAHGPRRFTDGPAPRRDRHGRPPEVARRLLGALRRPDGEALRRAERSPGREPACRPGLELPAGRLEHGDGDRDDAGRGLLHLHDGRLRARPPGLRRPAGRRQHRRQHAHRHTPDRVVRDVLEDEAGRGRDRHRLVRGDPGDLCDREAT